MKILLKYGSFIFHTGHSYHNICLREANISRCIQCEIQRRRRRQFPNSPNSIVNQQQSHGITNQQHLTNLTSGHQYVSRRPASATVTSTRHIAVHAAHVNVTLTAKNQNKNPQI